MVGITGASAAIGPGYRQWLAAHPDKAAAAAAPVDAMVTFASSMTRAARDHGEFGQWLDEQMRARHPAAFTPWAEDPDAADLVPTPDDWAAHARHVIDTVGPDHAGIGLDLVGGRSYVPKDVGVYPDLIAALERITTADYVTKIAGQNWLRVLEATGQPEATPARREVRASA